MMDGALEGLVIPQHVAIILDGNGRWAKSKGMPRTYGHTVGAKNVEDIGRAAGRMGVKYLTFYAFSTENWTRPAEEVSALMKLLGSYLSKCFKTAKKDNMRFRVIGDISKLSEELQKTIAELEDYTKDFTGLSLQIALNYGSRDEIRRAFQKILDRIRAGELPSDLNVTEDLISGHLDTADIPDPDLLIRTSGEQRLSNFLLWQLCYTEFYFTDKNWPEFNEDELIRAFRAYSSRNRRFGGIGDAV